MLTARPTAVALTVVEEAKLQTEKELPWLEAMLVTDAEP